MKRFFFTAVLISFLVITSGVNAADSNGFKIGLLVPTYGPEHSLGRQVVVGAKLGIEAWNKKKGCEKIDYIIPDGLGKPFSAKSIYHGLAAQGANALIGGITETHAKELFSIAKIPTVLLENSKKPRSEVKNKKILQLGWSEEKILYDGVQKWINRERVRKISILSDQNYYTAGYTIPWGAHVSRMLRLFHNDQKELGIKVIEFTNSQAQDYDLIISKVKKFNTNGVIVSALPWNMFNLTSAAAKYKTLVPMYVASPIATPGKLQRIALFGGTKISFGTQFWPDLKKKETVDFIKTVNQELGWPGGVVSSEAIKAYDAIQAIGLARCRSRRLLEDWKNWSWGNFNDGMEIQGITGALNFHRETYTLAGPITLLTTKGKGFSE